jgi:hypothetical protein
MLNYETVKRLKDAGLRVEDRPIGRFDGEHHFMGREEFFVQEEKQYDVPTLSELIDACGEYFYFELRHVKKAPPTHMWMADLQKEENAIIQCGEGLTPEEAVANLYLALHEKNRKSKDNHA